jgi:MoaA/NifB/PqqE/SkfB family radical SAM enzyme
MTAHADLDLLWALRSPCDLGCRYCYFGTVEDHGASPASQPGQLSHLSRADLSRDDVFAFAETLAGSRVRRVFLAGGEPLRWPPALDLIRLIRQAGVQVVVCTNGIALNRPGITAALTNPEMGADAVSVSLDSADPAYNDQWRPSRNRKDGWQQVTSGITALLKARADGARPRVGIYSVITRLNIADILAVPRLAAELGCDYAVPQPIALDAAHPLAGQLSLSKDDIPAVAAVFRQLTDARLPVALPAGGYPGQVTASIASPVSAVSACFGGSTLAFIEPDGSLWDCPSSRRIAATPAARRATVKGADARTLFAGPPPCSDCGLFSVDCVNMWPLTGFGRFLAPGAAA